MTKFLFNMAKEMEIGDMKSFYLFPQKKLKLAFLTLDKITREKIGFGTDFLQRCISFLPKGAILSNTCQTDGVQVQII